MFKLKSLRKKITFSFSLLVFTFMSVTIILIYLATSDFIEKLTVVYATQTQNKLRDNMDYLLADVNKMSLLIMQDNEIVGLMNEEYSAGSNEDLQRKLIVREKFRNVYMNSYDFRTEINIIDEERDIVFSSYSNIDVLKILNSEWYATSKLKGKNLVFVPTHETQYKYDAMTSAVTLMRKFRYVSNPKIVMGHILIDINFNDFQKVFSNFDANDIFVINEDSNIVYSNSEKDLYQLIGETNCKRILKERDGSFYTKKVFKDSIVIFNTSGISGWKIISIIPYGELMKDIDTVRNIMVILGILGIITAIFISAAVSGRIIRPLNALRETMGKIEQGELSLRFRTESDDEISLLADGFNNMLDEINALISQLIEKEKEKRGAMLSSLQSQINPHFLYNTLNSIRYLADNYNAMDIKETVAAFIDLLRMSISNPSQLISIKDEVENLKSYVKIQQLRYGNSFRVFYHIDEDVLKCGIPKLTLQPLVENAVFHGIEPKGFPGTIQVRVGRDGDRVVIHIIDDGMGMKSGGLKLRSDHGGEEHTNIGIMNIDNRIKLYFGEEYGVRLFSIYGCGTDAEVMFPAQIFYNGDDENAEGSFSRRRDFGEKQS